MTDGIVLRLHSAIELLVDAAGAELNTKNRYMQLLGPENCRAQFMGSGSARHRSLWLYMSMNLMQIMNLKR